MTNFGSTICALLSKDASAFENSSKLFSFFGWWQAPVPPLVWVYNMLRNIVVFRSDGATSAYGLGWEILVGLCDALFVKDLLEHPCFFTTRVHLLFSSSMSMACTSSVVLFMMLGFLHLMSLYCFALCLLSCFFLTLLVLGLLLLLLLFCNILFLVELS